MAQSTANRCHPKMALDKMLCPDQRKWISPLIHLEAKADELREESRVFMAPITKANTFTLEHDKLQAIKKENVLELAKVQGDKIKKLLFQPKKKQKKKKKGKRSNETDTESDEGDEEEFENGYEVANDLDELLDEDEDEKNRDSDNNSTNSSSGYTTTDSEDERPKHLRKYNKALDEIFIFYSDDEEEKEDGAAAAEADAAEPTEEPANKKFDVDTEESEDDGQKLDVQVQETNQSQEAEKAQEEKDTREFELFHKYSMELNAGNSQETADDLIPLKYILMGRQAASGRLGNCKIKRLAQETSPHSTTTIGEVIVDAPIIQGTELPLLAGPIAKEAVGYGAISLYTGLSDEPGRFQWKMSHVVELLTAQLRPRLDYEKDPEGANSIRVMLENDFIVTVTMYHAYEQPEGDASIDLKTVQEPEYAFEIEILGSQTVKDLTNMLRCQNDLYCTRTYDRPDPTVFTTATQAFETCKEDLAMTKNPEYLLLLHDTAYTFPEMEDSLSVKSRLNLRGLLKWTESHSQDFGDIKLGDSSIQIKDLKLRLGFPYVYSHQECCEHLVVFNSIRLPRVEDYVAFPRYRRLGKHPIKYCTVDNDAIARWVVVGCARLPQDPMFLCHDCVRMYCFNRKNANEAIGTFKMYPFLQLIHYL